MLISIAGLFLIYTLRYGDIGFKEKLILNVSIVYLELAYTTMTLLVTLLFEDLNMKFDALNEFYT